MLGGGITVDSEYNKGSVFTILLPLKSVKSSGKANFVTKVENMGKNANFIGKKILIVDDSSEIHEIFEKMLEKEGYILLHAYNGEEAISLAKMHKPDLITLDVIIPLLDGWSTLSMLKSDPSLMNIPVILVSMLIDSDLGFALGAVDYMPKPINDKLMIEKIRKYLPHDISKPILLVDDDVSAREIMGYAANKAGFKTLEVSNGKEAIEILSEVDPAMIILDLMMPEMDGFTVLKVMQANDKWRTIPVIIVTAKDLSAQEKEFLSTSCKIVLQKGMGSYQDLVDEISLRIKNIS